MKQIIMLKHISSIEAYDKIETPFQILSNFLNQKQNFLDKFINGDYSKLKECYANSNFYPRFSSQTFLAEDLIAGKYCDTNFLIEDKKVYYKPYLKIITDGNVCRRQEFETFDEVKIFQEIIRKNISVSISFLSSITFEDKSNNYLIN